MALLTYLAAAFPRFRYGHAMLSQSFRNPALLAKMSASLQLLTGGRFILGLGAGWHAEEYRAYGYEYPSGAVRVAHHRAAGRCMDLGWSVGTVYRKPYETLRRHCETIGRPFEEITLTAGVSVSLPDDPDDFVESYKHSFYGDDVFYVLGPTPADAIREIERLVDVGVSHLQVTLVDMASLRRFVDLVVPAVRLERRASVGGP